ncbi:DUF4232 domain-containing protein [Parafrankia sp. CH37]|nr:DUF4232 domain-containing protein [Parafrankia sp. CH37]
MRHIRAHIAPVTVAAAMTACGLVAGCDRAPDTTAAPLPPKVSAPATLAADGTVPWVDEPAADSEFTRPARLRWTITTDRHCQASDLAAVLPAWQDRTPHVAPGADDQESRAIRRAGPYGLMGTVEATNISTQPCTLSGRSDAQLLVDDQPARVEVSNAIDEQGELRITQVNPGERAGLRLDWSPPYCGSRGRQALRLTLPHGGGTLTASVTAASAPPCSSSEIHPELRTFLSVGAWDELNPVTVPHYALTGLTATLVSPTAMTAPVGATIDYVIRLTNPADAPMDLHGVVYGQELFSLGDATRDAVNTRSTYRLNTRPVPVLAAKASQNFRFRVTLPAAITQGRELSVSWRPGGPEVEPAGTYVSFTVTAR